MTDKRTTMAGTARSNGFTLIELIITVTIIAILAALAYPSYTKNVAQTNRSAATSCLSQIATYMERYYTTNLAYNQDLSGTANTIASITTNMACTQVSQTGSTYNYSLTTPPPPSAPQYTVTATAYGVQATRDPQCGVLSLDQAGNRSPPNSQCW